MRGAIRLPTMFTRAFFRAKARVYGVRLTTPLGELKLGEASPREFSTGSLGWLLAGRLQIKVGEATVFVQANLTLTVCNSAALPRDDTGPAAA